MSSKIGGCLFRNWYRNGAPEKGSQNPPVEKSKRGGTPPFAKAAKGRPPTPLPFATPRLSSRVVCSPCATWMQVKGCATRPTFLDVGLCDLRLLLNSHKEVVPILSFTGLTF